MQALGSLRTPFLLIAQLPQGVATDRVLSVGFNLARDANALASSRSGAPAQASPIAFESIFSVNHVDANKLKVNLMERVGKAFGLDLDDFDSAGSMARSINEIVAKMEPAAIREMEKDLGLDDLGVSLRDVLDAMEEPGGDSDRKLDAALHEQAGDMPANRSGPAVTFDELGLYSL